MARIRSIKPEFCTSEQLASVSRDARLLFVLLWMFCDDRGVHPASIKRIKMEVFPGDALEDERVSGWIRELLEARDEDGIPLLGEFESGGKRYWSVCGWHHQRINRPTFKYPEPPSPSTFCEDSRRTHGGLTEPHPPELVMEVSREVSRELVVGVRDARAREDDPDPLTIPPLPPSGRYADDDYQSLIKTLIGKTLTDRQLDSLRAFLENRYNGDQLEALGRILTVMRVEKLGIGFLVSQLQRPEELYVFERKRWTEKLAEAFDALGPGGRPADYLAAAACRLDLPESFIRQLQPLPEEEA